MTPVGEERLRRELALGWRPLVIRPVRDLQTEPGQGHPVLRAEQIYDAVERNGAVLACTAQRAIEVEPDEYAVLAWGISDGALKKIGVRA